MVDEQDRASGTPVSQGPALYWQPRLRFIFLAAAEQRREIVNDDKFCIAHRRINLCLPRRSAEVRQPAINDVRTQQLEEIWFRRLRIETLNNRRKPPLHGIRRHLAIEIKHAARLRRLETEK